MSGGVNSFVLSFAYCEQDGLIAFCTSKCTIEVYETGVSGFKHWRTIDCPCLMTGIWYLTRHNSWLAAGKDNKLRKYDIRKFADDFFERDPVTLVIEGHTDQIMAIQEIKLPPCIATASLDRTIRLYNLIEERPISVLRKHTTGVRALDYISNMGGFFISVGHETCVHVWSPETAVSKCFVGKLSGHVEPVVDAKFIPDTTLIVSIEEKLAIRVFDVFLFECKQVIYPPIGHKPPCLGLVMVPGMKDMFAWFGRRFIFYDTSEEEAV